MFFSLIFSSFSNVDGVKVRSSSSTLLQVAESLPRLPQPSEEVGTLTLVLLLDVIDTFQWLVSHVQSPAHQVWRDTYLTPIAT